MQNLRLILAGPNLCCFLDLLFHMVMSPLLSGMKISWIKLKPVPFKAKTHKVCLLDWLIFIKYGISSYSWGQRQITFFFFFFLISSVWKNWGISNFPTWIVITVLGTCVKLTKFFCLFSAQLHCTSWFKLLTYSGNICNSKSSVSI